MRALSTFLSLGLVSTASVSAFTIQPTLPKCHTHLSRSTLQFSKDSNSFIRGSNTNANPFHNNFHRKHHISTIFDKPRTSSSLFMGYNLPPGNQGPGDKIKDIVPGIVTIAGLALFFMSPLGGIFFAITNSLLALAFITPFVLIVGFQIWEKFFTLDGQCPNCGSPVKVLKDDNAEPNICLSCGSLVRATKDKDGVELCNDPNSMFGDDGGGNIFDSLFGGGNSGMGGGGLGGNVYRDDETEVFSSTTVTTTKTDDGRGNKNKRGTIIDVDIEED